MNRTVPIACALALAATGLASCGRSEKSATPDNSTTAAAMPQASAVEGAQGPGTAAPHEAPPSQPTLSDSQHGMAGNVASQPATGGMAAAGSINDLDRATPDNQSSGKANAAKSP